MSLVNNMQEKMNTQWVKERLVLLQKTHEDVARHLNKHRTIATKIINGEQPLKINQLSAFAKCLETTIPIVLEKLEPETTSAFHALQPIPIFSSEEIGDAILTSKLHPNTGMQYLQDDFPFYSTPDSLRAMLLKDDSMNRIAPTGSIIVIDCHKTDLVNHQLYIFQYQGKGLFRRYRCMADDHWIEPDSLNPRCEKIFKTACHNFRPLGKVITIYTH